MYAVIKIGDRDVPMLCMASSDIYYRQIFHEDAIKLQTRENVDTADQINFITRMAFVMAKYAELKERKEMMKLNEDAFLDWLDQFDRADFYAAFESILRLYEGQSVTASDAKKNSGEPSDK